MERLFRGRADRTVSHIDIELWARDVRREWLASAWTTMLARVAEIAARSAKASRTTRRWMLAPFAGSMVRGTVPIRPRAPHS